MFRKIDACRSMEQMKQLYPCRYRKLNIHSYFRHQTLEVRHHSGTTDPAKITNWVRLMASADPSQRNSGPCPPRQTKDQ
jgi:hypothetical protein